MSLFLDKKCSWCCDPVKVFFGQDIPKDSEWKDIWIKRKEIWISEKYIDSVRLEIYDCILYDKNIWLCSAYENRPEICNKSWCFDKKTWELSDEVRKRFISDVFIKLDYKWKK